MAAPITFSWVDLVLILNHTHKILSHLTPKMLTKHLIGSKYFWVGEKFYKSFFKVYIQ
ncbi:unnamed protein product, partial [Arabidopsis halleri]